MSHLTTVQLTALQAALLQREAVLRQRLAEHHGGLSRAEHAAELLEQDGHDAPRREAERELDMAQSDRDTLDLASTAQALKRVHDASYGRCADCDEDIPYARLQAEPWTLCCVECAGQRERLARRGLA